MATGAQKEFPLSLLSLAAPGHSTESREHAFCGLSGTRQPRADKSCAEVGGKRSGTGDGDREALGGSRRG